ncbi:MAG TPA: glutathione-disulfide reductase [Aquabacterium sp.]|uniref:glutathione-disulfide reductase n=1 Tax=Aquabacterium sp. TaxID=1872578 RepID=UPI002E3537E9|nr:glutathione-disulfide reductase [Aquabacterium sp.]HEX5356166.1 glutathione-disulfide reductase [Aquabacterium sp.]
MPAYDCQLFVIGGGSGGVRAARVSASLGAKVAIAERFRYGGTCVIRGCVPKKLLVYAAQFAESFEDAAGFGWQAPQARFSWPDLIAAKDKEITRLSGLYEHNLSQSNVEVLHGDARLIDPHTVELNGRRYTAQHILVSTGGTPHLPTLPGIEHAITSNEAFDLPQLPGRILIVGGGYIAVEFAGIFNGLGAHTTLSHRGDKLLRGFDDDVRTHLQAEMQKKGIQLLLNNEVQGIERLPDGRLSVTMRHATAPQVFDAVMYATGRRPQTQGLGLAALGVALDTEGGILVDEEGATNIPSIHAVGDVTNGLALTPVAIREGSALAHKLFGPEPVGSRIQSVPTAVFSQPPVGTVGLSEAAAWAEHTSLDIYRATFRNMRHTLAGRDERTLVKLIVDTHSQRVLGAHMVGTDAPEIIQGLAIAIRMGATKADFDATVALHPSAAEEFVTLKDKVTLTRP